MSLLQEVINMFKSTWLATLCRVFRVFQSSAHPLDCKEQELEVSVVFINYLSQIACNALDMGHH